MNMQENMTEEKESRKIYEIGYHLVPFIAEEKIPSESNFIKDALAEAGSSLIFEDNPKLRPLAYTIRKSIGGKYQKFNSAYFGWVKFEIGVSDLTKIKKALDGNPNVLRYIIIETVRESTLSSARPFFRESRPPRETKKIESPKTVMSEEELDKTIAELVVE